MSENLAKYYLRNCLRGEDPQSPQILDVSTPTVYHTTTHPEPFPSSVADILPRKKAKWENGQRIKWVSQHGSRFKSLL